MKKSLHCLVVLLSLTILLNSFTVANNPATEKKHSTANNPVPELACFIQLNDGSFQHFTTLELVTGVLITPHLLADGKLVIDAKDIMAYQNEKHFAVSPKILTSRKKSQVAVETLPGFAVRVISGKLNVYARKYYNGCNTVDEYFLQNGDEGYIVTYSKEMLKTLLKEDTKAIAFLNNNTKKTAKSKTLLVAVEIYNNSQLMTKN